MIRGIVQNGMIRPLDPIPAAWVEGHQVIVEDRDSTSSQDIDEWFNELRVLGPAQYEPGEWERVKAILMEADELAKEQARREMGLS